MTDDLRIMLADDHPAFRRGLRAILATTGIEVVGEATNGQDAASMASELQPDVVIMDLHMPPVNGVEATRRIVTTSPHIAVLVLTMYEDDDSVFAAMRAGARGYLLKGADQDELLRAVHAVAAGEAIFGPTVAHRMIEYFARTSRSDVFPELTEREREILELVAKGLNNATIAARLDVSAKTVRNHVSNIFTKLQVVDRAEAIVRARDAGLGVAKPKSP